MSKARGCLRKWGFGYLDGVWPPSTEANQIGTRIHKIIEDYLRDGTFPTGDDFATGLFLLARAHLPLPKTPGLCIEVKSKYTIDGIEYVAVPDLEWFDGRDIHLRDHKTSRHGAKYALKHKAEYLDDVQFLQYARHLLDKYPTAVRLYAAWIYYETPTVQEDGSVTNARGKPYKPSVKTFGEYFTRGEIIAAFGSIIVPLATKLINIRAKGLHATQLEGNMDECHRYGGCYYRERGCDPMQEEDESMAGGLDDLMSDFDLGDKPKAAPAPATKPDVVNAPEKALAAAAKVAQTFKGTPDLVAAPPGLGPQAGDSQLAYRCFELCVGLDSTTTFETLRDLCKRLLAK